MDRRKSLWIKIGIPIAVGIVFLVLMFIGKVIDSDQFQQQGGEYTAKPYIEISALDGEQVLVSDVVAEWLKGEADGVALYNKYSGAGKVYSAKPVTLKYAIYDIPTNVEVESQVVELSENSSFENAKKFELTGNKRSIRFDYLFANRNYYYRINATLSNGTQLSSSGQFKTADTPRIISTEGVWNMRDIGGVKTLDGKTIKQGLVYRGVELDGAVYERYCITEAGAKVLTDELGIRTEIDLREPKDGMKDMLGSSVAHNHYPIYAYVDSFVAVYSERYRTLFSDLSKEENYPVYIHCTYGKDRTGTICFLLQLLLGVSVEDAFREFEMSVLFDGEVDYGSMEMYIDELEKLEGDTMQEKVENFLMSYGVTQQEIDDIRRILLED